MCIRFGCRREGTRPVGYGKIVNLCGYKLLLSGLASKNGCFFEKILVLDNMQRKPTYKGAVMYRECEMAIWRSVYETCGALHLCA